MIRVALDTNALYTTRAGVARYIGGLQHGFAEINSPDLEISDLAWQTENFGYTQPARSLKTFYRELVWAPFVAPNLLRQNKIDVLHSPAGPFVRPRSPIRSVVTLHDLAVFRFPQRFRRWHRTSAQRRLKTLHQADQIICVSQFTADEAMKLLGLSHQKLVVIHNGMEAFNSDGQSAASGAAALPANFLLFVGSLEPGKNLRLLREMYILAEKHGKSLPPLVIIGARWLGVAGEGTPPNNWTYFGHQSDSFLKQAYERANALLFPSVYEGFGFPIIEAQAAGCPVICSPVASLPEIAGNGALFVDLTPEKYLEAISRLERDCDLRDNLLREGRTNAMRFSWRQCAEQTAAVYRQGSRP
jgi:glycosyltransferase involved in cell wall biosynthesis